MNKPYVIYQQSDYITTFIPSLYMYRSQVIDYGKIKQYAEEHKKQHPDQEEISFIFALMRW